MTPRNILVFITIVGAAYGQEGAQLDYRDTKVIEAETARVIKEFGANPFELGFQMDVLSEKIAKANGRLAEYEKMKDRSRRLRTGNVSYLEEESIDGNYVVDLNPWNIYVDKQDSKRIYRIKLSSGYNDVNVRNFKVIFRKRQNAEIEGIYARDVMGSRAGILVPVAFDAKENGEVIVGNLEVPNGEIGEFVLELTAQVEEDWYLYHTVPVD